MKDEIVDQDPIPYDPTAYHGNVYLIKCGKYYKIGYTRRLVQQRLVSFRVGNPHELEIVASVMVKKPTFVEASLHTLFYDKWHRNEWFVLNKTDVQRVIRIMKEYGKK